MCEEGSRQIWIDWSRNTNASAHGAIMSVFSTLGQVAGLDVIDIGCGTGAALADFETRGARVAGVDADPAMIAAARARLSSSADLGVADFNDPAALSEGHFDVARAAFAIAYAPDAIRTIALWARMLRPGGRLVLIEVSGLLDHEPMCEKDRVQVAEFYRAALQSKRYDFHAVARLDHFARRAGLEIFAERLLDGAELSLAGSASPYVLAARSSRLGRMPALARAISPGFGLRFLESLSQRDHQSHAPVHCVLARVKVGVS